MQVANSSTATIAPWLNAQVLAEDIGDALGALSAADDVVEAAYEIPRRSRNAGP